MRRSVLCPTKPLALHIAELARRQGAYLSYFYYFETKYSTTVWHDIVCLDRLCYEGAEIAGLDNDGRLVSMEVSRQTELKAIIILFALSKAKRHRYRQMEFVTK